MVVAKLAKPEAKFILNIVYCQLYWKDENEEKEAENGPFRKRRILFNDYQNFELTLAKKLSFWKKLIF